MPLRICKNPTTRWLSKNFHATPLLIPEEAYQPMQMLVNKKGYSRLIGHVSELFENGKNMVVPIHSRSMANAALDKTTAIDIDLGLDILNGFFKALKMENLGIKNVFGRARTISLSFTGVQRHSVDLLQFGNAVADLKVNLRNPVVDMINKGDDELLMITDAITSKGFTINDETENGNSFEINIPLIEKYIADADLGVDVKLTRKNSISFEGAVPLCFAFSCAELFTDEQTAQIRFRELTHERGLEMDSAADENQLRYKKVLDDDEHEPLMIEPLPHNDEAI